jgi:streptogramin lyase
MIRSIRLARWALSLMAVISGSASLPAVDMLFVSLVNGSVVSYNTAGNNGATIAATAQTFTSTNLEYNTGIAFDTSGNLYVANASNSNPGSINKYDSAGNYLSNITTNVGNTPQGLAIDGSGNIYVANIDSNTISKYNASGTFQAFIGNPTNLDGVYDLAFDSSGYLYASNMSGNTVSKFDTSGTFQATIGSSSNLDGPGGLAFDSTDNLFVTNVNSPYKITQFDSSGGYLNQLLDANLNGPQNAIFDSSGNLYVASYVDDTIAKYGPTGTFLTKWTTAGTPAFMSFQPTTVPEPSTYALAAIASGVMAAVARRRKARQG